MSPSKLLIFFIFLFSSLAGVAQGAYTVQTQYSHVSGTFHLEFVASANDIIYAGDIHYSFYVLSGSYVASPNKPVIPISYYGSIWGIPQYVYDNEGDEFTLDDTNTYVSFQFIGPTTYESSEYANSVTWSGSKGTWKIGSSTNPLVIDYLDYNSVDPGLYYWKITVTFGYSSNGYGSLGMSHTIEVPFSDVILLRYKETGNWATDIANGGSTAFSTIWTIWSTAGSKITNLNWGAIVNLDVLGFLGDIITTLAIVGYAIFEMFTVPIRSISIMMQYSVNIFTVSFFFIEVVGVIIVSALLLWGIWKVIILLKP